MSNQYRLIMFCVLESLLTFTRANSQEHLRPKNNWIGMGIFFDVTNTSFTTGLSLERIILHTNRASFGIRTGFFLPYRSGNASLDLAGGTSNYGYGKAYRITLIPVMATAQVSFTDKHLPRFYLTGAFGGVHSHARKIKPYTGDETYQQFLFGAALGVGAVTSFSKNKNARIDFTVSLCNAQKRPQGSEEPLVLAALGFAIGF